MDPRGWGHQGRTPRCGPHRRATLGIVGSLGALVVGVLAAATPGDSLARGSGLASRSSRASAASPRSSPRGSSTYGAAWMRIEALCTNSSSSGASVSKREGVRRNAITMPRLFPLGRNRCGMNQQRRRACAGPRGPSARVVLLLRTRVPLQSQLHQAHRASSSHHHPRVDLNPSVLRAAGTRARDRVPTL